VDLWVLAAARVENVGVSIADVVSTGNGLRRVVSAG
jgi:hypothetical protein